MADVVREGDWYNPNTLTARSYICGYCGVRVSSEKGWYHQHPTGGNDYVGIRICPECKRPTLFIGREAYFPGPPHGHPVANLPSDIEGLYDEVRKSIAVGAYTAAVMAARKILMNVAVGQGAATGLSFAEYVDYLEQNHYTPPKGKIWVDHIRSKGNEANHEIALMGRADAETLVNFLEMLLKFIYEFPATVPP